MMQKNGKLKSGWARLLERSNKPILVLAIVAIALYLLELLRVVPKSLLLPFLWVNFIIDLIFLLDLILKSTVLGRSYIRSPWFLIDFLSTLPIISSVFELMGAMGPQLQAARVARGARVARIARITRVARLVKVGRVARLATAIRAKQGLSFLKIEDDGDEKTPRFNKSLFIGVPILLIGFILASSWITNSTVSKLTETINLEISQAENQVELEAIQAKYDVSLSSNPVIETTILHSELNGGQEVPVSLHQAFIRADRITGIMLLVVLLTIGLSVFISNSLSTDRSLRREHHILCQCFSPPIVDRFYSSPEVVNRFFRQWMTVFFIDIRGFTKAVEKDSGDVEGLALKLRKVMDVAREQIVISHEGIIDKFMGDAVMGWVGGHFSVHWKIIEETRKQLYIDEIELVEQDIKSITREIEKAEKRSTDPKQLKEFTSTLKEANNKRSELLNLQETTKVKNPQLMSRYQNLLDQYRKEVAKSAVDCCLRIWQEVESIDEPDSFNQLKVGIGSGQVLIGNFGATNQIAYTVLGPTVNRAARLEPASAQSGCKILIDENTYELLKDDSDFTFRRLPKIGVKGIKASISTYEPFFGKQISESFLKTFGEAVEAMEEDKLELAMAKFSKSNELRSGGDTASRILLDVCKKAFDGGESVGIRMMKK